MYFPNYIKAPLFFASAGQVNIQIPWELEGQSQTTLGAATGPTDVGFPQTVSLAPFAPGIFSVNAQSTGQGTILDASYHLLDASYHLVDAANPATGGSTVLIYCTGLGAVTSPPLTGSPASPTLDNQTANTVEAVFKKTLDGDVLLRASYRAKVHDRTPAVTKTNGFVLGERRTGPERPTGEPQRRCSG